MSVHGIHFLRWLGVTGFCLSLVFGWWGYDAACLILGAVALGVLWLVKDKQ